MFKDRNDRLFSPISFEAEDQYSSEPLGLGIRFIDGMVGSSIVQTNCSVLHQKIRFALR